MTGPILEVRQLVKRYTRGFVRPRETFRLEADFIVEGPSVIGIMGPNGSGKTTLFELITGSNTPTAGEVLCQGRNIHAIRPDQRDRLAIHYHQSYQVRRFRSLKPRLLMERAESDYPVVHLFDEPQFNTQDGYIGFMLAFFRKLRADGRVVFLCLHPTEAFHLEILREICERFVFVLDGRLTEVPNLDSLLNQPAAARYLGAVVPAVAQPNA